MKRPASWACIALLALCFAPAFAQSSQAPQASDPKVQKDKEQPKRAPNKPKVEKNKKKPDSPAQKAQASKAPKGKKKPGPAPKKTTAPKDKKKKVSAPTKPETSKAPKEKKKPEPTPKKAKPPKGQTKKEPTAPEKAKAPTDEKKDLKKPEPAVEPKAPQDKKTKERKQGFMALVSVGLNGCTGSSCQNMAPMVHVRLHLLYRFQKYGAAGLHTAFLFNGPLFENKGARTELWDAFVGPEIRALLPLKEFDLWTGLALGYEHRRRLVVSDGFTHEIQGSAIGLAWGIGIDRYLLPSRLAMGADFWLYKGWFLRFCSTTGDNKTICSTQPNVDEASSIALAVGLTLTLFLQKERP
ncbi:MAG: hypothetical protein MUC50_09785 [Myxococcota bacterium]|nr:hypothetical protein [Myxococcota bacterium]